MASAVSRRAFLSASTAAVLASERATSAFTANERLNIGLIGCGGQGTHDARSMLKAGGDSVRVVALADPDRNRLDAFGDELAKTGQSAEKYEDYRKILDRKDVDAVICGTPDHWHALVTVAACQAGKDVYVEKPCSHNIREGRAMVEAARKYGRIVQVGQQQRSDAHFRDAIHYLREEGTLGRIVRTITFNYDNETPHGLGHPPDEDAPPPRVNYDLWLGPAPLRKFNRNRFHWAFRWFYDYAGGMMTDWNVHLQDIVHWGLDLVAPKSICAAGGKYVLKDDRDTPDMLDVVYEYDTNAGPLTHVYTMGRCYHRGTAPRGYGIEFLGPDGSLFIDRGGWEVLPANKPGTDIPRVPPLKRPGHDDVVPHARNFLDCVRSREWKLLHCDIETGHRTASVCHLGNLSHRLGNRKIYWDAQREIVTLQDGRTPDAEANRLLGREYRSGFELPEV